MYDRLTITLRGYVVFAATLSLLVTAPSHVHAGQSAAADGRAVIGVVTDGGSARSGDYFDLVASSLADLSGTEYQLEFVREFNADFSLESVENELRRALADPRVEVVFAAGPMATEIAANLPTSVRNKPVFGGFPELSDRRGDLVTEDGKSAVPNFTFAATPQRVSSDLTMLRRLTGAETIHVVMDEGSAEQIRANPTEVATMSERVGAKLALHALRSSADEALDIIPADAEAAYITVLPRFVDVQAVKLLAGLADRGTFTLTLIGPAGVLAGATASLAADLDRTLARRSAVSLHQLCRGTNTKELDVYVPSQDQLFINSRVADQLGWTPDYETYLSAEFTARPASKNAAPLVFEDAMDMAAENNADARVVREGVNAADADRRIARSALLPRLDLNAEHGVSRIDSRINPNFPANGHAGSYGVELSQILFDDSFWSGFRAQRRLAEAAEFDALSAELDARAGGGSAYLRWVLAHRLHEIEDSNRALSVDNLRLARLRVEIGAAEPSEVYRWEAEVARARARTQRRLSDREATRSELNRVMGAPREARWQPRSIPIRDTAVRFMDKTLAPVVSAEAWSERLHLYFQRLAVERAPELASFDHAIEAQGIILGQKRRAYFAPSVAVQGGVDHVVEGAEDISTDSELQWTAGVSLSLPLFESGRRSADIDKQRALVRQLDAQRQSAVERIETRTRTTIDRMAADHANIRLSRRAVEAAEKNYRSIEEKYSQGAATILDLLDAQSGLLLQRQEAESAVYSYLIGIVDLQRAIAWFESTAEADERAALETDLSDYLGGRTAPGGNIEQIDAENRERDE